MKLTDVAVQQVIRKVLKKEDYRAEILTLINAEFMQYAIDFFEKIVAAKLRNENINVDWYKKEFLNTSLSSGELIINSGLNNKTIKNSYGSERREVILDVTLTHYNKILETIDNLIKDSEDLDFSLTIKFRSISIDLNISESLVVINSLAAKHSQIRGGAWSTAGKRVEKPLMVSLCKLFNVADNFYNLRGLTDENREVDFFLIDSRNNSHKCEVKLMGRGNPESADVAIARQTQIFIADTLSQTNKIQLSGRNVQWVELNTPQGYKKFLSLLNNLDIPAQDFEGNLDDRLDVIFHSLFV